jgi:hypothetical protein
MLYKYHVRVPLIGYGICEMCGSFTRFTAAAKWAREILSEHRSLIFEGPTRRFTMRSLLNHDGSVHYLPIKEIKPS